MKYIKLRQVLSLSVYSKLSKLWIIYVVDITLYEWSAVIFFQLTLCIRHVFLFMSVQLFKYEFYFRSMILLKLQQK